jgi:hypothetical protein
MNRSIIFDDMYLFATLLGLIPLSFVLIVAGRLRNTSIICGAVLSLYSPPVAWLYDRVYWTPGHVFGGRWGIEDLIFCFHAGVVSWLCALWPWQQQFKLMPDALVALRRLTLISVLAIIGLACLLKSGITVFMSFLTVEIVSTAILIAVRPSYVRLVVSGVPLFMAYYFSTLSLWRFLMPGFMQMWNGTELTGTRLQGIPIEEYLWVMSFCVSFPITMAFALDIRLRAHRPVL